MDGLWTTPDHQKTPSSSLIRKRRAFRPGAVTDVSASVDLARRRKVNFTV